MRTQKERGGLVMYIFPKSPSLPSPTNTGIITCIIQRRHYYTAYDVSDVVIVEGGGQCDVVMRVLYIQAVHNIMMPLL